MLAVLLVSAFFIQYSVALRTIPEPECEYDYIVVGSGPSGAVVASKLATLSSSTVLLVEAGSEPTPRTRIPGLASSLLRSPLDWAFLTDSQKYALNGFYSQQSAYAGGRVLGGGTTINAMGYYWPSFKDMDRWASIVQDDRWKAPNLVRYMQEMENAVDVENRSSVRGVHGPMRISSLPCEEFVVCPALLEAARYRGYPVRDMNSEHDVAFMPAQRTIYRGERWSVVDGYLNPTLQNPKAKLDILDNSLVEKIIFDKGKTLKATKVTIKVRELHKKNVRARKSIILAAGAIFSPYLLMLSGIGPAGELNKLQVPVVKDLPVGQFLLDQIHIYMYYRLDPNRVAPFNVSENWEKYLMNKTGPLAQSVHRVVGRIPLTSDPEKLALLVLRDPGESNPKTESHHTNAKLEAEYRLIPDPNNPNLSRILMQVVLLHPKSVGNLTISSTNSYPNINPKYLSEDEDVSVIMESMRLAHQLMSSLPMKHLGAKLHLPDIPDCQNLSWRRSLSDDNYIRCWIRYAAYAYGVSVGTCKMGPPDHPDTVVDSRFRVLGVKGLRVVDLSVLPDQTSSNPQGPMLGIAAFAADTILQDLE